MSYVRDEQEPYRLADNGPRRAVRKYRVEGDSTRTPNGRVQFGALVTESPENLPMEKTAALASLRDDREARHTLAGKKKRPAERQHDPLLGELERVEGKLQKWLKASKENALWFEKDPVGAMQAAGLDIEDEIMLELERITAEIARKLK